MGRALSVSVAVPVRNEEATIEEMLDSLLAQTVRPDEIVIADGGSTDRTVAIAGRYSDRGVRVLELGPAYPGRGRNEAVKAARNEWIAFIDGGCVADPQWLEKLLARRDALGVKPGIVFGESRPRIANEWDAAQALAFLGLRDTKTGYQASSIPSSLLHRDVWRAVGGFPEHLRAAEDLVFLQRLEELQIPRAWSPGAVVHWRLAPNPSAVFRRFRLYSAHHLAAGLFRTWHLRVMMMDGVALLLGATTTFWPPSFLLLCAGGVGRVLHTVARRRFHLEGEPAFRPDRLLRVAFLLCLADAATWIGALDYLMGRERPE
jgi:glycosyltransferase involved in cell wall biosynthesis